MLYLISYDLRVGATTDDYARIIGAIETMGGRRVLYSQFALRSGAMAGHIFDSLRPYIDANDRLLVSEITDVWAGWNLQTDIRDL